VVDQRSPFATFAEWYYSRQGRTVADEVTLTTEGMLLTGARQLRGTIYGAPRGWLQFLGVSAANDEQATCPPRHFSPFGLCHHCKRRAWDL
jgi:hypothetical protein